MKMPLHLILLWLLLLQMLQREITDLCHQSLLHYSDHLSCCCDYSENTLLYSGINGIKNTFYQVSCKLWKSLHSIVHKISDTLSNMEWPHGVLRTPVKIDVEKNLFLSRRIISIHLQKNSHYICFDSREMYIFADEEMYSWSRNKIM